MSIVFVRHRKTICRRGGYSECKYAVPSKATEQTVKATDTAGNSTEILVIVTDKKKPIMGDVNKDSVVTILDSTAIQLHMALLIQTPMLISTWQM